MARLSTSRYLLARPSKRAEDWAGNSESTSLKSKRMHYSPFPCPVRVYMCGTDESCYSHTGSKAPAVVTTRLFLSPKSFQNNRPLERYLTHELSHLHIEQSLGFFRSLRLPAWFKEGLAELVSGGAQPASGSLIMKHLEL